ncbi:DUF3761 domain-containing protein [Variovorax sp. PvP013]|uniref:DUF3761 domain-containing protein n=1 Tax=Variovorax sp. PvP013 TaxID=3156435 RepID=UPI003D25F5AE
MRHLSTLALCSILAATGFQVQAQSTQAKAPAGSTAQCNDGSYSKEAQRSSACTGHKGVKTWLGVAGEAVQTQSPAVSATQAAPTTGLPSRTPGTPENPVTSPAPAPRSLPASAPR